MSINRIEVDHSYKLEEDLLEGGYNLTGVVRNQLFQNNDRFLLNFLA